MKHLSRRIKIVLAGLALGAFSTLFFVKSQLTAQEYDQQHISVQDIAEIMGLTPDEARSLADIALDDGSAFGAGQPGQYLRSKSTCSNSCAVPADASQCYLCCNATPPSPGVPSRSAKKNCQTCCNFFLGLTPPRQNKYEACMAECDRAASADEIEG